MAEACECGNVPPGSVKCGKSLTSCKPGCFTRRTLHHGVSVNESNWDPIKSIVSLLCAQEFLSVFLNIGLKVTIEAETCSQ